jgi:hypothetical protein
MSQLKVNALVSYSGNTVTLGTSGDTINVASGVTFNTASATVTLPTTIKVDTIQNTNSSTLITQTNSTTITVGVSGQTVALPSQSISYAAISNPVNFRNRIINGDMQIDQRNNGSAVTVNDYATFFSVDRFKLLGQSSDGVFTAQRSSTAPTGFVNSLLITVTTADASIGSSQEYTVRQNIEGYNVADLGFGTANAKTITLSFWVRSSVTGAFGGSFMNNNDTRTNPFSYTINSANTWEYKTITITGDTSGTWQTTTSTGLCILWSLGVGTGLKGTAGTWSGSSFYAPTSSVNLISTLNATLYITGVQLEAGSQASGFEFLPVDVNLIRCQRYFSKSATNTGLTGCGVMTCVTFNQTELFGYCPWPVTMRATPTVTIFDNAGNSGAVHQIGSPDISGCTPGTISSVALSQITKTGGFTSSRLYAFTYRADAEL